MSKIEVGSGTSQGDVLGGHLTYVWEVVLKGCVIPCARPDEDAGAFHATFHDDYPDISYKCVRQLSADVLGGRLWMG